MQSWGIQGCRAEQWHKAVEASTWHPDTISRNLVVKSSVLVMMSQATTERVYQDAHQQRSREGTAGEAGQVALQHRVGWGQIQAAGAVLLANQPAAGTLCSSPHHPAWELFVLEACSWHQDTFACDCKVHCMACVRSASKIVMLLNDLEKPRSSNGLASLSGHEPGRSCSDSETRVKVADAGCAVLKGGLRSDSTSWSPLGGG